MATYICLRITFLGIAGLFSLLTLIFEIWRKRWRCLVLDIFVYFVQMPLWIIIGVAIVGVFPELVYSYFSGIWIVTGLLLWIMPHCILAVKAIRRKDWLDVVDAFFGVLAIISFCIFINFWDMTKNVF